MQAMQQKYDGKHIVGKVPKGAIIKVAEIANNALQGEMP